MKWYWVVAIIAVSLVVGYMIGKNTGATKTAVVTSTPAVVTTSTGTNG